MKQITKEEIMEMSITLCYPDGSGTWDYRIDRFIGDDSCLLLLLNRELDLSVVFPEEWDRGQTKMLFWWDEEEIQELKNSLNN